MTLKETVHPKNHHKSSFTHLQIRSNEDIPTECWKNMTFIVFFVYNTAVFVFRISCFVFMMMKCSFLGCTVPLRDCLTLFIYPRSCKNILSLNCTVNIAILYINYMKAALIMLLWCKKPNTASRFHHGEDNCASLSYNNAERKGRNSKWH